MRRYQSSHLRTIVVLIAVSIVLSTCTPVTSEQDVRVEPSAAVSPNAGAANSEALASIIEPHMRYGPFASVYSGMYAMNTQIIVLVTDQQQAVMTFLREKGVPPSAVEVRRAANSMEQLREAEVAGTRWLEHFVGAGGIGIDIPKNRVVISVEREPLLALIAYDPGTEPVPYRAWPPLLQQELAGIVPDVAVELRAGFMTSVPELSSEPASIP